LRLRLGCGRFFARLLLFRRWRFRLGRWRLSRLILARMITLIDRVRLPLFYALIG
jgi:hypothetical protein